MNIGKCRKAIQISLNVYTVLLMSHEKNNAELQNWLHGIIAVFIAGLTLWLLTITVTLGPLAKENSNCLQIFSPL